MKKILFFLLSFTVMGNLFSQQRDYTAKWLYNHDNYVKTGGKNDPRVKWAFEVFKRVRVVAIGGTIEIVEQELSPVDSISRIIKKFGMPQKVVRHTGGNFYVYKDRSFSVKEVSGRVCSYIWFEKGF